MSVRLPRLRRLRWLALPPLLPVFVLACASRAGGGGRGEGPPPARGAAIGALDPAALYRQAGMIVQSTSLPFVGSVRYVAGRSPDTTLVLVTASLANRSLTFTSDGAAQRAAYRAALDLQQGAATVRHAESREVVRVASFRETSRADESVVFQQFLPAAPGQYSLTLALRDEGSANGGMQQQQLTVPRLGARTLSSPITVYAARPRASTDSAPALIANPRSTVVFGRDSVAPVYLEGYGVDTAARVALAVLNDRRTAVWRDTVTLPRRGALASAVLGVPVPRVGVGPLTVAAWLVGAADTVRTPLFVTFGEELGITTFDELLSYLRYYATPERLQALRDAAPEQRAAAWAAFWKATDPAPSTPEHEGLRDYFARIQSANQRFTEEGTPGWLTDRGKVFITLGEPDQLLEQGGPGVSTRGRTQIWIYGQHHAQLVFIDQTGFGRWRLTPSSEADFQQIARRERVH